MSIIHHSSLLDTLPLEEDLITPSHEVLPGWSIPQGPANNAVPLPARLTLLYHLPVELHAMAEQLRQRLALLGCELTIGDMEERGMPVHTNTLQARDYLKGRNR